ncbi:hypothetical protein HPB52_002935 [Rhipicephalus sanguineus]|uniref:Uncharacterized protein n=1 Tax=Rhipicephalus sanguineus TaxID=34632 RepID=A0A9D4T8E3_RHISA|nr:hypothetical protein HPB52_002935 [Rhipicephalus sanguineus]
MAPVRRKEFCPSYFAELVGPTRARYEAKISMCDGVDPYTLCAGTDMTTDVELLPVTTHADIVICRFLARLYREVELTPGAVRLLYPKCWLGTQSGTRGSQSKVPVKQQKIRNGLESDPESSCEV